MLVLSRQIGERVLVGDSIVVTVLESRGQVVRIGIEAPRTIVVLREEIAPAAHCPSGKPADITAAHLTRKTIRGVHGRTGS